MSIGILDLPTPLLALVDDFVLFWLPAGLRVALWGLLTAWMSSWIYRRMSNQRALASNRAEVKALQVQLSKYDGEFSGLWPLIGQNLKLSSRQIGMGLWPALLALPPVLFVLPYLSNTYGVVPAAAGSVVEVCVLPAEALSQLDFGGLVAVNPEAAQQPGAAPGCVQKRWLAPTGVVRIESVGGMRLFEMPADAPYAVVARPSWLDWLILNPAGRLPVDAPVDVVEFGLPGQQLQPFGPDWLRGWEAIFFSTLIAASLWLRWRWKMH